MPSAKPAVQLSAVVLLGLGLLGSGKSDAQTFDPYAAFQSMTPSQLESLQGKIAFVGQSLSPMPSIGFAARGHAFNRAPFVPFYRPAFDEFYAGDIESPRTFTATRQQLKALIDSVATLPGVTDGGVDSSGYVSFALLNIISGDTLIFESIVDTTNGRRLFPKLIAAMNESSTAVRELSGLACATDMLPAVMPTDASRDVSIRLRGVHEDSQSRQFVGTIRVTNTSGHSLVAPLILVFRAEGNVDLANADGRTCRVFPSGAAYLNLPVGVALTPGAHVDVAVRFVNPDGEEIKTTFLRVMAGEGTR